MIGVQYPHAYCPQLQLCIIASQSGITKGAVRLIGPFADHLAGVAVVHIDKHQQFMVRPDKTDLWVGAEAAFGSPSSPATTVSW